MAFAPILPLEEVLELGDVSSFKELRWRLHSLDVDFPKLCVILKSPGDTSLYGAEDLEGCSVASARGRLGEQIRHLAIPMHLILDMTGYWSTGAVVDKMIGGLLFEEIT